MTFSFSFTPYGLGSVPSGTRLCLSCSSRVLLAGNGECGKLLTFFPRRPDCVCMAPWPSGFFGLGRLRATSGFVSTVPEIVHLVIKKSLTVRCRHRDQQCHCCSVLPRSTYLLLVGVSFSGGSRVTVSVRPFYARFADLDPSLSLFLSLSVSVSVCLCLSLSLSVSLCLSLSLSLSLSLFDFVVRGVAFQRVSNGRKRRRKGHKKIDAARRGL